MVCLTLQGAVTLTAFPQQQQKNHRIKPFLMSSVKIGLLVHEFLVRVSGRFSTFAEQVVTFISTASDKSCVEAFSLQ